MQLEDSKYAKKENDLKVVKKAVIRVIERCLVEPTVVLDVRLWEVCAPLYQTKESVV